MLDLHKTYQTYRNLVAADYPHDDYCAMQVVPSGSLAVFTEDDTAAAAAAAKPDPMQQMQDTISELQQQVQAMARTQEAMAKCILGKQSGSEEDKSKANESQSGASEATSVSETKSEEADKSSKSWLPSLPSFSRAS